MNSWIKTGYIFSLIFFIASLISRFTPFDELTGILMFLGGVGLCISSVYKLKKDNENTSIS